MDKLTIDPSFLKRDRPYMKFLAIGSVWLTVMLALSLKAWGMVNRSASRIDADSLRARDYFEKGDSLRESVQYEGALAYYDKAIDLFILLKFHKERLNCLNRMASIHQRLGQNDLALEETAFVFSFAKQHLSDTLKQVAFAHDISGHVYRQVDKNAAAYENYIDALKIKRRIFGEKNKNTANSYYFIGLMHRILSDYDSAEVYFVRAMDIRREVLEPNHSHIAHSHNSIGSLHYYKGNYKQASESFIRALDIERAVRGEMHPNVGIYYDNIGAAFRLNKSYQKAFEYNLKALSIFKETYGEFHYRTAGSYVKVGRGYMDRKDHESALTSFEKALEIAFEVQGKTNTLVASVYDEMAHAYSEVGKYDATFKYASKALEVRLNIFEGDNIDLAWSYSKMASSYFYLNRFDSALYYFDKAIKINQSVLGLKNIRLAQIYSDMAELFIIQEMDEKALAYCQKSIIANSLNFNDSRIEFLPVLAQSKYFSYDLFLSVLRQKASVFERMYHKTKMVKYLDLSLNTIKTSDSLINIIRNEQTNDADKITVGEYAVDTYRKAVPLYLKLAEVSARPNLFFSAFLFSEKNKISTLNNSFQERIARKVSLISDSLLSSEQECQSDLSFYQSQLIEESSKSEAIDSLKIEEFQNRVFALKRRHELLIQGIEENNPRYHQLKYDTKVVSVRQVQRRLLEKNESFLEYFIGDTSIYAFVINKETFHVKEIPKPRMLDAKITDLNRAITQRDAELYSQLAFELYGLIYKPIESLLDNKNVIIVPDGNLWYLNFDLLLSRKALNHDYRAMSYLIHDYNFNYGYSATLLWQEKERIRPSSLGSKLMAFSFGTEGEKGDVLSMTTVRSKEEEDLPGSRKEIRMISKILDGDYFYGTSANESNFKTNAGNYSFIHMAVHGEIDEQQPENSKLYFSSDEDSLEDGRLYTHELYNMELNAELVVLSACNTGRGKLVKGEGIMSLGRAFTYAGCKSLVLTLWELNDAISPNIMRDFYVNINDGERKSQALRLAKLKHLKNADNIKANPFFWGSFVLIGDNRAVEINREQHMWVYLMVLFAVCSFAIGLFIRYRSNGYRTIAE